MLLFVFGLLSIALITAVFNVGMCGQNNLELLFTQHKDKLYWVLRDFTKFSFLCSPSLSLSFLFLYHICVFCQTALTLTKSYFYKLPTLLHKKVLMRLKFPRACVRSVKYGKGEEEINTHQGSPVRTDPTA